MIWATVSSRSCFSWLYTASPSSATKNIINLIFIFMIWWSPRVVSSLMLLEEGVSNDQGILLAKLLLAFVVLHFVIQSQTCLLLQVSLEFLFLHFNPLWWIGLVGLHRIDQLLQHRLLEHRLLNHSYCDLNGLPWKWPKIILLFLRLCPNTAFLTLLLTVRVTPFLLWDSSAW